MIVLGLTGSIGMGKSTAASMFAYHGAAVHDADQCVHGLLKKGSPAWPAFAAEFPYFQYPQIYQKGWKFWRARSLDLNRAALGKLVFANADLREKLENILHPFVRSAQQDFLKTSQKCGKKLAVLDIPLLFETGADQYVDYTVTVTAPAFMQHKRVLARPGMTREKLAAILERQMPDGEKCARADFVIHSGLGRAHMMREIKNVIAHVTKTPTLKTA